MQDNQKLYAVKPKAAPFKDVLSKKKAYMEVFGGNIGQKVLEDIVINAGFYSPELDLDPQRLAENAGKRKVVFGILNTLVADIEEVKPTKLKKESIHDY